MRRIRPDHAEGRSRAIEPDAPAPEAQPRGALRRPGRPVDHAEAARRFLAAPAHLTFHDKRLWDLREKRDREARAIPQWEALREQASAIKEHALSNLAHYLEMFESHARARGIVVHWAEDAAAHNRIVSSLLRAAGATRLVKSKSMLTEECGLRDHLAREGVEVVETDLGERIQQLDGEDPSHVVVPAVHKLRSDVAAVFARTLGSDPANDDPAYLAERQRLSNRPLILDAAVGMTGANFLVAETGGVVVCTNEGNADLCMTVPRVHLVSAGIEKVIPRVADLGVFIRLLSRSALGSPITQYTTHVAGPRPGGEMHVVLVDNGRSARLASDEFWTSLKCIRCGACMNTCPVYRRSGGLSYGATYAGPIGLIVDPTIDRHRYSALPLASTLNGSCTAVCPVKIDIHGQILGWRRVMAATGETSAAKRAAMAAAASLLSRPAVWRTSVAAAHATLPHMPRFTVYNRLNVWGRGRELPAVPEQSFHAWWRRNRRVGGT